MVQTLNGIQPYDWAGFLNSRVNGVSERAPLAGFTNNGYRLVYSDQPTPYFVNNDRTREQADLSYSLGLVTGKSGSVNSVAWGSPAFDAGLTVDSSIVAVNGESYSADRLKAAVTASKGNRTPIRLLVKNGDKLREVAIDYHDGLRYPRLEKTGQGETGLDRLLAAK